METDEIKERIAKGHSVTPDATMPIADIVIGPNCFRLSKETINLLPLAEKAARNSKYPPVKEKVKSEQA